MYRALHVPVRDPRGVLFDADAPLCRAKITGWTCTIYPGHQMPHGAGDGERIRAIWDDDRASDSWWARLSIWWERRYLGAPS